MTLNSLKENSSLQWILLGVLSVIWGSSFILIKKGLEAFSPTQVGTLRIVFAFLILLPIAIRYVNTVFKTHWKKIFILGIVSNMIPAILFAVAETGLSSSLAGILNSLTPIMTLVIGALVFSVAIKKFQVVGLIIGLAGSVTITLVGDEGAIGSFNYFALFVIAATVCYGIGGNMIKTYFTGINPVVLTSLIMLSIGPFATWYVLSSDFFLIMGNHNLAWESLGYLFLLGAVGTAFALILFNKLIQLTTAVSASSVTYLIPIVAVIWGVIDGESLFILHFAGMLLIIFGVYITNKSR